MISRLSMKRLALFSRQLGAMLEAGISIRRALAIIQRGARGSLLSVAQTVGMEIQNGLSFSEAIERQGRAFPVLYQRLVHVGETAGRLDHILTRLGDYYDFLRSLWRKFLVSLIWPLIEYWGMILVLAAMTYIRATLANDPAGRRTAALILLAGVLIFFAPIVAYFIATRMFSGLRIVHEVMIRIPIVGAIMRTIAIARFSWSMEVMTAGGVRILDAIKWSMEATANGAFEARSAGIIRQVESGVPFYEALQRSGLFPHDYTEMVSVAEESGSMPDIFARLARQYFEKMEAALKALGQVIFWLIWMAVAGVIIYHIFRIFGSIYGPVIDLTNNM